jgi:site-specific recombinase XerD
MGATVRHPLILAFLHHLRVDGRAPTADGYAFSLQKLEVWATTNGLDLEKANRQDLITFAGWLAHGYRAQGGKPIAATTQGTVLAAVHSLYAFAFQRGRVLVDPAAELPYPRIPPRSVVRAQHLTLQETIALLQTQAHLVDAQRLGSPAWARLQRDLAMLCLAISTGRRSSGVCEMLLTAIDPDRNEVRIEVEKGKPGRVLPIARGAMAEIVRYRDEARPVLLRDRSSSFLFVGLQGERVSESSYFTLVQRIVAETVSRNQDLAELPGKHITTHSLRVSFATILHENGCSLRSLNELLLHEKLSTTAAYTPLSVADLRRVFLVSHPRA